MTQKYYNDNYDRGELVSVLNLVTVSMHKKKFECCHVFPVVIRSDFICALDRPL